jgi:hypothetical protein
MKLLVMHLSMEATYRRCEVLTIMVVQIVVFRVVDRALLRRILPF